MPTSVHDRETETKPSEQPDYGSTYLFELGKLATVFSHVITYSAEIAGLLFQPCGQPHGVFHLAFRRGYYRFLPAG